MRIGDWSSVVCSSDLSEIRSSVKLFPPLADVTLHHSCFFDATANGLITAPVAVIVGNPPFESSLTTEGAKRSYAAYIKEHGALADKQLAYLFLHDALEMLAPNGDRKGVVEGKSVSG